MKADDPNVMWLEEPKLGLAGKMYLPLFVQGLTTYKADHRSYDNLWVIQLTADGRASSFTEWYMPRK